MELLRCRTRLAVLWVIKAMGFSVFLFLSLMEPGTIEGIMAGNVGGTQLSAGRVLMYGFFWWIPWVMAWLSMTLKGAANRWTNFVLGILFAIFLIRGVIVDAGIASIAIIVDYIVGILISLLIAWYAWKLPKQEA